ncbi:metallophosphoesterase [Methylobacterium sp. Leaf112]|uniref:metallophosphoesterase n=1 Tax=Methylobacterium sp. Leaf112 TaxID=1736258 RepID=UPI0007011F9B|nr:metallophosphoesterase [Methylobacterium sp. Leaf112]KQP62133.1 metallophosphoesterase [Methylobacterium sp. Leaf112]
MAVTYLTSDTHFGHAGMMSPRMSARRNFPSIEAHDEHLIASWNNRVRPEDRVLHLGDFAYGCSMKHAESVFARLRGRKTLIRGNHEQRGERLPWDAIYDVLAISIQDTGMLKPVDLWLSHYCHLSWPDSRRGRIHLYGHSHGAIAPTARSCDVGVDPWGFRPVTIPEVMELLGDIAAREQGAVVAAELAEAA